MGFSEMGSEGWMEPTDDTIWQFCDELNVSRFERFGPGRFDALQARHPAAQRRRLRCSHRRNRPVPRWRLRLLALPVWLQIRSSHCGQW